MSEREASRRWRERNPNHAKEYYQRNKKKICARQKEYRAANRAAVRKRNKVCHDRIRKQHLGRRKRCDICQRVRRLFIDHKHGFCGHKQPTYHCRVCRRGALCRSCNGAIGMLQESLKLLGNGRAGQYVRHWNTILRLRKRG